MEQQKRKEKQRAYKLFRRVLTCSLRYAVNNPIPEVVSARLAYLSDVCLEHLCNLRGVEFPDRTNPGIHHVIITLNNNLELLFFFSEKLGAFLIAAAEWMAIAIERIYFNAQYKLNNEIAPQEANDTVNADLEATMQELDEDFVPLAHSSEIEMSHSFVDVPCFESTKRESGDHFVPLANSTKRPSQSSSKRKSSDRSKTMF